MYDMMCLDRSDENEKDFVDFDLFVDGVRMLIKEK